MSVGSALSIADSGLAAISAQLALVSHNVANAATPGYATETAPPLNEVASGQPLGVRLAPAQRATDESLRTSLLQQNAAASAAQARSDALSAISQVQGAPGSGQDLPSLLGALQDAFSKLLADPSSQPQQQAVLQSASDLAGGIRTMSGAIAGQRQAAQDAIVAGVASVNAALSRIGAISDQIVAAKARGDSTADLENQRDAEIGALSSQLAIKVLPQANGNVIVTTASGVTLPIRGGPALTTSSAAVGPASYYPGNGIPPIAAEGVDITAALTGGTLGADIALRDTEMPRYQAELDEFAQTLSAGLASAGLPLFSDGSGNLPVPTAPYQQSGYIGYSATIVVNPAVAANPSAVRDGLPSANSANATGFTGIATAVLTNVLGVAALTGNHVSGLGPFGQISASFGAPATLADFASTLAASQANDAAQASDQRSAAQAMQATLQEKLSSEMGVNMDTEMSSLIALQNAYGANAKVIGAMQTVFGDILGMLR